MLPTGLPLSIGNVSLTDPLICHCMVHLVVDCVEHIMAEVFSRGMPRVGLLIVMRIQRAFS